MPRVDPAVISEAKRAAWAAIRAWRAAAGDDQAVDQALDELIATTLDAAADWITILRTEDARHNPPPTKPTP